jgi:hypothetical protein
MEIIHLRSFVMSGLLMEIVPLDDGKIIPIEVGTG